MSSTLSQIFGVITGGGIPAAKLAATSALIGAGFNGVFQLSSGQKFDWVGFGAAGATGAASAGLGFTSTMLINTGGALATASIKGENPHGAMATAAAGTAIGYPMGVKAEKSLDGVFNPWYRPIWQDVGLGMSTYVPRSMIPSTAAGMGSAVIQEVSGPYAQKQVEKK